MGAIIYWAILRFAIVLIAAWALHDWVQNYGDWWSMFFVAVAVVVIFPMQVQYRKHQQNVEETVADSLCASCKYYSADSMLCMKLDEHVTIDYIPCEGMAWEPRGS